MTTPLMLLTVPAGPEWTLVMRMAAAGLCALKDLPLDVLEDVRTAVDESCELLMHQKKRADRMTVRAEETKEGVTLSFAVTWSGEDNPEEEMDEAIGKMILETLVRRVGFEKDEAGVCAVKLLLPRRP